jgi:hypothetical protein
MKNFEIEHDLPIGTSVWDMTYTPILISMDDAKAIIHNDQIK